MLFAHTLSDIQIDALREVVEEMIALDNSYFQGESKKGGGALRSEARKGAINYRHSRGIHDVEDREISVLLTENYWASQTKRRHSLAMALVVDYLMLRFEREVYVKLKGQIGESDQSNLPGRLWKLKNSVYDRLTALRNPFSLLAADLPFRDAVDAVPSAFIRKFCGYRRSARKNDVIRFTYEIERNGGEDSAYVTFTNKYIRSGEEHVVRGGGVYADRTLFLFGHAKLPNGQSAGYRMQALQEIKPGTNVLVGPVISKFSDMPLAARILLIPTEKHDFPTRLRHAPPDRVERHILAPPKRNKYTQYVDDLYKETSPYMRECNLRSVFFYVSNLTDTVIWGRPDSDHPLMEKDIKIRALLYSILKDEEFEGLDREGRIPYRETLDRLLQGYLNSQQGKHG